MQRLYDWLLRRRLIREPQWGQAGITQRLLRIRFPSALLLSLPALLLCAWYAFAALAAHVGHQAEVKAQEPLTIRLFQLHLHDKLTRDWHRLIMPEPQHKSALPTYGLVIGNEKLDQLASRLPPDDGVAYYVDGQLVKGSRVLDVQVRYRGGKYWHYNHPQKSWMVRVKGGKVFEGLSTFNFINSPDAVPFEEEIILDIARELGLVTPVFYPFRLLLNKAYMGVHFFEAQPDEGLLRQAQRPHGSIYSGSDDPLDAKSGKSRLFKSADYFTKVTQGVHQQIGERQDLEALIEAINQAGAQKFASYAERHLDLDKFAKLDALDVVFGCNQYDINENHKFYFDPYRDRFEPVAWSFRGCKHESELNRTDNPLLLRLKQLPDYLTRRNRVVYELLLNTSSPESLRRRTRTFLDKLEPDQARDPYWDAYQLLPGITPYYSSLLRPVSRRLQNIANETLLFELGERNRYLAGSLEEQACTAVLNIAPVPLLVSKKFGKNFVNAARLDVTLEGNSGYALTQVGALWPSDCHPDAWRLFADTNLSGSLEVERDRALGESKPNGDSVTTSVDLYPGTRFEPRLPQAHRGPVRAVSDPRTYRFFMESAGCAPVGAIIQAKSLVTNARFQFSAKAKLQAEPSTNRPTQCDDKYSDEPGQLSPHPWCYVNRPAETIAWGPGVVEVEETRIFAPNQSVVIAPGTTLRLSSGVSLIFMGRVDARGTAQHPIAFEPRDQSWGGIAIQGPDSRGSRFDNVRFQSGSRPISSVSYWPGMVNVHDTAEIAFNHCTMRDNTQSSVVLHVAETQNLSLDDLLIRDASSKALELEYSTATLNEVSVIKVAGDAISLSGSQATIRNSKILAWAGDGISASQRSKLSLFDVVLAGGNRGLLVGEASTVQYERVLLFRDNVGLHLDALSDWYAERAHLKGKQLYAVGCKEQVQKDVRRQKILGKIDDQLAPDTLTQLRNGVLNISNWGELDARINQLLSGSAS